MKNYVGNKIRGSARHNFIEMTGKRFGRLTVIRIDRSYHDKVQWWCRCDCGKEGRHRGSDLRRGIVKSCRCLSHDNCHKSHLEKTDPIRGAVNKLLTAYKNGSKSRKLVFDLDVETFRRLTSGNCFYCGIKPMQVIASGKNYYYYNGLDRINNDLGYMESNTVTCCKNCNKSKSAFSQLYFYNWVKRTHKNLQKKISFRRASNEI